MDVYLSTVSNRLNAVMKQLAIIATVFMPLTFLTGFFGQNLGWMVAHVGGVGEFLVFGIALELTTVAIVLDVFLAPRLAQPVRPGGCSASRSGHRDPGAQVRRGDGCKRLTVSGMWPAQTSRSASGVSPSSGLRRAPWPTPRRAERQHARGLELLAGRRARVGQAAGQELLGERLEDGVLLVGVDDRRAVPSTTTER